MDPETPDESERRYQQLIRTSPAPINLFDASGEILWGNDAVVELLGLESRSELIGRSIFDFIHAVDRYTAERELVDVVENGTATGPTSMQLERADGEIRQIRVSTAPGEYRGRRIGQAVVIDVTRQKAVQAELESERRFIEDSLNALQDVFYVIDPAGELDRWNQSLLDVSGYASDEVRALHVEDLFVDRDVDRVSQSIEAAFLEGEETVKANVCTKYGNEVPFEFRMRRLTIEGETIGLVGIGRDISIRNARERHLKAVDHILRHNLRNQLNVIQGTASLLRDSAADRSEGIERIEGCVDRLISLFDDHNRILKLLTSRETPRVDDVVSTLESVTETLSRRYPAAEITRTVPQSAPALIVPTLETAFLELVENAIKHSDDPNPSVELAVEPGDSTVSVHVIDTGPTIPRMEYEALADGTRIESTFHPTGLGLWFVHLAVKDAGGTLRFGQSDSGGNVVTVELRTPRTQWAE